MTAPFSDLTSTTPPWLLRTAMDRSLLERELNTLEVDSGFAICFLDGSKMNTVTGVFGEFARGLQFPDYFGFNSSAFDDCLNDLSWLNADGICIVIAVAEQFLADESGEIGWLFQLLEDACEEWGVTVEENEEWDRPPIPFHVLFHAVSGSAERLPPQIAVLPSLEYSNSL